MVTPDVTAFLSAGAPTLAITVERASAEPKSPSLAGVPETEADRAVSWWGPGGAGEALFRSAPRRALIPGLLFLTKWDFWAPFSESFIPSTSPWMVALTVILPSLLLLIAGGICLIKKLRMEKKILSMQIEVENEEKEIARKELGKERVEKEKERQIKGKRVGRQFTVIQKDTARAAKSLGKRERT